MKHALCPLKATNTAQGRCAETSIWIYKCFCSSWPRILFSPTKHDHGPDFDHLVGVKCIKTRACVRAATATIAGWQRGEVVCIICQGRGRCGPGEHLLLCPSTSPVELQPVGLKDQALPADD